jgi:hypothetical protein
MGMPRLCWGPFVQTALAAALLWDLAHVSVL